MQNNTTKLRNTNEIPSLILLVLIILCGASYAEEIYKGTLVDAHSQKGELIAVEEISVANAL